MAPSITVSVSRAGIFGPAHSFKPRDLGFDGPASTIANAEETATTLTLDLAGSSFSTLPYDTVTGLTTLPPPTTTSPVAASTTSAALSTSSSHSATKRIYTALVAVAIVLAVFVVISGILLLYFRWRRRRGESGQPSATKKKPHARHAQHPRAIDAARMTFHEMDVQSDPFGRLHVLPKLASNGPFHIKFPAEYLVQYTRDAGSVYVLPGEYIYGDNGASVKGMLPPAYDDLPVQVRLRPERELPPLPPVMTSLSPDVATEHGSATAPSPPAGGRTEENH